MVPDATFVGQLPSTPIQSLNLHAAPRPIDTGFIIGLTSCRLELDVLVDAALLAERFALLGLHLALLAVLASLVDEFLSQGETESQATKKNRLSEVKKHVN